jgi:hypothetical protein
MAKRLTLKLKTHKASGRLYKCIGKALGKDGRPKPKVFYFDPSDVDAAARQVLDLKAEWRRLRAEGKVLWDESAEYGGHRKDVHADGVRLTDIWTDLSAVRHRTHRHRDATTCPRSS